MFTVTESRTTVEMRQRQEQEYLFSTEELASAFSASKWKTTWQSVSLGGYSAQRQLCFGQEPSAVESQKAMLTAKPPLMEANPVSAQA